MRRLQWPKTHPYVVARVLIVALLLLAFWGAPRVTHAANAAQIAVDASQNHPVAIYFFWGDGCPHCAEAEPFLLQLVEQYPNVEVRAYEVWYVETNRVHFQNMAAAYGLEPSGVPTIFIGDRYWVGYSPVIAEEIAATVVEYSVTGSRDAGLGIIPGIVAPTPIPTRATDAVVTVPATSRVPQVESVALATTERLDIPFFGTIDLGTQSLVASTALIAFVDGFNPCSLWVLSMLLALTLHTNSRRKTFWIGLIFLTVTALIYALFIIGLFTIFSVVGFLGWIQAAVALVALFFAAVNIKDYFWYKEGISFTIADAQKPSIYRRMRAVMDAGNSSWGLVGATVVLAAGVSLVEFSCTAGFPIIWTNLLTTQQASAMTFGLLLLLYMAIYQLDELGIFLAAVITLKSHRLEETQGRILKLVGGMLMLALALVMLLNPAWMSSLSTSLIIFGVAFLAAGAILLVHRLILPRLGVSVGSELRPPHQRGHRRKHKTVV